MHEQDGRATSNTISPFAKDVAFKSFVYVCCHSRVISIILVLYCRDFCLWAPDAIELKDETVWSRCEMLVHFVASLQANLDDTHVEFFRSAMRRAAQPFLVV